LSLSGKMRQPLPTSAGIMVELVANDRGGHLPDWDRDERLGSSTESERITLDPSPACANAMTLDALLGSAGTATTGLSETEVVARGETLIVLV
jgi:hypothetical protein